MHRTYRQAVGGTAPKTKTIKQNNMEDEMRYRRIQSDYRYTAKLATVTVLVASLFITTALFARPTSSMDELWWASATKGEVLQQERTGVIVDQ